MTLAFLSHYRNDTSLQRRTRLTELRASGAAERAAQQIAGRVPVPSPKEQASQPLEPVRSAGEHLRIVK